MSKYDPLWNAVAQRGEASLTLTFAQIENILGFPIDHAFLRYKKELAQFGYTVVKISRKEQTVLFQRISPAPQ